MFSCLPYGRACPVGGSTVLAAWAVTSTPRGFVNWWRRVCRQHWVDRWGVGRVPTPSARQLSAAGRGQEHSKCSQSWAPQRVASCTRCALGVHGALKGGQHRHPATLKPGLSRCSQWVVTEITPVCFFGLLFKEKDVNALLRSV